MCAGMVLASIGAGIDTAVFEGADAVNLPNVHFDVTRPAESYAQALTMLGL